MKRVPFVVILLACSSLAWAQAPSDVPQGHWAYDAVKELIDKGYLTGYPDGSFVGTRTMTRYEFATVVKRILDDMDARIAAAKPVSGTNETTSEPGTATAAQTVASEDVAAIKKLVDEFKTELVVIGTRLDTVEATVAALKSVVDSVNAIVTDPEGAFEATKADVSKLKKLVISGYVQTRYNVFRNDPDTNDRTKEPTENFSVRRARVKFAAKPTDNSAAVIQIDCGQGLKGDAGPAVTLKDAYVDYAFAGDSSLGLAMTMGQMKWPFGYEVVQSSAVRESPERALITQRLFPSERDRGFQLSCPFLSRKVFWKLGVFNGEETKYRDINNNKDLVSTVRVDLGDLNVGVSGYFGKGILGDSAGTGVPYYGNQDPKTRVGADVEYYLSDLTLKAEYMRGTGVDGLDNSKPLVKQALWKTIDGYWAQAAYNVTKADTLVAKFETISLDPKNVKYGRRSTWNLGVLRWLDDKTRLKFFYQINTEAQNSFNNDSYIFEWITVF